MRIFVALIVIALIALMSSFASSYTNDWVGAGLFIICATLFISSSVRFIPNKPPQKAIVTIFGRRMNLLANEGWNFFPGRPIIFNYILFPADKFPRKQDRDMKFEVRTPDGARSEIPYTLALQVDPSRANEFVNSGGEERVFALLEGKIAERLREWCRSQFEGPADWEELQKSTLEALSILIPTITDDEAVRIPESAQVVPTYIWTLFLRDEKFRPKEEDLFENQKKWARDDWGLVKAAYIRVEAENEVKALEEAIDNRKKQIKALREGNADVSCPGIGINVKQLNLRNIEPIGQVAEVADRIARELIEGKAEILEIEHVSDQVTMLQKKHKFSDEQALEIVQTENGKVKKEVNETKWNVSPETREMIKDIAPGIIGGIASGIFGKRGDGK